MARYSNFTIVQGEPVTLNYTIKDSNGNPFNLTGYTVSAALMRSYTDPNDTSLAFTVVIVNATNGTVTVSLGSNQTLLLALDNYSYEVMITNGSNTYQVLTGLIQVVQGINTRGKYTYIPADEDNSYVPPQSNLVFTFASPENTWTLVHNLNSLNIIVTTYDTNGNQIQGSVQLVDLNTVSVTFASPQSGTAIILG